MENKKAKASIKRPLPDYKPPYKDKIREDEATTEEKRKLNAVLKSLEVKRPHWWYGLPAMAYIDMVGVFLFINDFVSGYDTYYRFIYKKFKKTIVKVKKIKYNM